MKKLLFVLFYCTTCCADPLTKAQNAFELAFTGELIADYQQSSQLGGACTHIENCKTYETNPLLGREPSNDRLRLYFAGVALTHYGITWALPERYRLPFQTGSIILEAIPLRRNARIGLHIKF